MLRVARIHCLLLLLVPLLATGCQTAPPSAPADRPPWFGLFEPKPAASAPQNDPAPDANPATGSGGPIDPGPRETIVLLQVRFDILQVRVRRGVFSVAGKIWNHLDEQAIPSRMSALLQKNGLRVARGRPVSWPPIQALLEEEKGVEISATNTTLANGLPLTIDVNGGRMRDQTLFLFREDGTLGGSTSPMSTNLIRIEYSVSIDMPQAIQVDVMPQIQQRQVRGPLTLNQTGQFEEPIQEPTRVLRELAFRMVIPPEEYVVIGPSASASEGHLAGSLLLCEDIAGKPYESMYFITPRLERSDRKLRPQTSR